MTLEDFVIAGQWVFLAYFVGINAGYLMQNVIAAYGIRRYLQTSDQYEAENVFSALDIPISIVIPAYNESTSIITSVKAMLQLEYPQFELVVVALGEGVDPDDHALAAVERALQVVRRVGDPPLEPVLLDARDGALEHRTVAHPVELAEQLLGLALHLVGERFDEVAAAERVGDVGDVNINPYNLEKSIRMIEAQFDDLLAHGATTKEIKEAAYKQGFFTLADDGVRHIIEGVTSIKEVARVADLTERMG